MKTATIKLFGVLLLLSFLFVAMPTPAAQADNGLELKVYAPHKVYVCEEFEVTAKICNCGSGVIEDVEVELELEEECNLELVEGDESQWVGDVCTDDDCCKIVTWTLKCTGPGEADFEICAEAADGTEASCEVEIEQKCRLEVEITKPQCEETFCESDIFAVTAVVTNNSYKNTCDDATVCLEIEGPAELVGGSASYNVGGIEPMGCQEINWTLHCTGEGDVELEVIPSGCDMGCPEECADEITIHQRERCDLELELFECEMDEICVCEDFTVKGEVCNEGCKELTDVEVELEVTEGMATITEPEIEIGTLSPGECQCVEWTVHCDGRTAHCTEPDYVSFEGEAEGYCEGEEIYSDTVCLEDYVDQKYLIVEITEPVEPNPGCFGICACNEFFVNAEVTNCFEAPVEGTINISFDPTTGAELDTPPGAVQQLDVPAGETVSIPLRWHVHCVEPGFMDIKVRYSGITPCALTLCDYDEITICQKAPAELDVELEAPDCVLIGDKFTVKALVTNPAGCEVICPEGERNGEENGNGEELECCAACAEDVCITLETEGDVNLLCPPPQLTDLIVCPDEPLCLEWEFECTGCADAEFEIEVEGTNPCPSGPAELCAEDEEDTKQVAVGLRIVSPEPCSEYEVSDTFCVTAVICNSECEEEEENGDNDNEVIVRNACIELYGNVELVEGETACKPVGEVLMGDSQEISWTVHCSGPGPGDIKVVADVYEPCELTLWDGISVCQEAPPVKVEILSPAEGSLIATSQDFAVTVEVTNKGERDAYDIPVTIMGDDETSVLYPDCTQIIDVPLDETVKLTWTLHCEEAGTSRIEVFPGLPGYHGCCDLEHWQKDSVTVVQYPAAHLEVDIMRVTPSTTVNVSDEFDVYYKVTNTGEADATEVVATLSVTPEGSARPVAGPGSGYTQNIGTLAGHGQDGCYMGVWKMHCKEACESNIVITASGNDEYGWHKKQACESSGSFSMEDCRDGGFAHLWSWCDCESGSGCEAAKFWFKGNSSLIGTYIFNGDVAFNAADDVCCEGQVSVVGFVSPDGWMCGRAFLKNMEPCGEVEDGPGCAFDAGLVIYDGEFVVQNGMLHAWLEGIALYDGEIPLRIEITNAEYCTTMASENNAPIPPRFIESDTVTVKQLSSGGLDLGISKTVDEFYPEVDDEIVYTLKVTNYGPSDASGVVVMDELPDGLSYEDHMATQGDYDEGDGEWTIGNMVVDSSAMLMITATVDEDSEITNTAMVEADQPDGNPTNDTAWVTINASNDIELMEGWNLISLPLIPDDSDIEVVMDAVSGSTMSVWYYDAPTMTWLTWTPGLGGSLMEMEDGKGYWVNMDSADTLPVSGKELPDPPAVPPTYDVVPGWNMIGFKSVAPRPASDYLMGINGNFTLIYGYANGKYFLVQPSANLMPKYGYWIAILEVDPKTIYP